MVIGDGTAIITIDGVSVTCDEAQDIAFDGISEEECSILQAASGPCGCQGVCDLCGDSGAIITNPYGIITVDDISATCAETQAVLFQIGISDAACCILQDSADACKCLLPSKVSIPARSFCPTPAALCIHYFSLTVVLSFTG